MPEATWREAQTALRPATAEDFEAACQCTILSSTLARLLHSVGAPSVFISMCTALLFLCCHCRYVTLASAAQAACVVERLTGLQVRPCLPGALLKHPCMAPHACVRLSAAGLLLGDVWISLCVRSCCLGMPTTSSVLFCLQMMDRQLFVRPLERNVQAIKRRYPKIAAEAEEALVAAMGNQRGPGVAGGVNAMPLGRQRPQQAQQTQQAQQERQAQQAQQAQQLREQSPSPRRPKRSRSRSPSRSKSGGRTRGLSLNGGHRSDPASNGRRTSSYGTPDRSASPEAIAWDLNSSGRGGSCTPARSRSPH